MLLKIKLLRVQFRGTLEKLLIVLKRPVKSRKSILKVLQYKIDRKSDNNVTKHRTSCY